MSRSLRQLMLMKWIRHDNTLTSCVSTGDGTIFTASSATSSAATNARFVRVDPTDGDVLLELGTAGSAPSACYAGSLRIRQGAPETFQVSNTDGSPKIRVKGVSGPVNVGVQWGL